MNYVIALYPKSSIRIDCASEKEAEANWKDQTSRADCIAAYLYINGERSTGLADGSPAPEVSGAQARRMSSASMTAVIRGSGMKPARA